MSSLGLYHDDLCGWLPLACLCLLSVSNFLVSLTCTLLILVSSLLGSVHYTLIGYKTLPASFSSRHFSPRERNFEAMLNFLLFVDSSGSLLLLKLSRSSRNRSIDSSSLCLFFQISSSLDDPSSLIRIVSTVSRRF